MPLNYQGTEQIGNLNVWSFQDESGSPFKTDDPMLALQLGAPVGNEPPQNAPALGVPVPSPPPAMPAPGQITPGGLSPSGAMPDPTAFGLGDAGPERPMLAQVTPDEQRALEAAGMANAHPARPDASGSLMDRYDTPPPAPQPRDVIRPDENPQLDFGEDSQGATQGQPVSAGAPQTAGLHPLTERVAGEMPERYRYVPGTAGGWNDQSRAFKGVDPEASQRLITRQDQLTEARMGTAVTRAELVQQTLLKEQKDLEFENMMADNRLAAQRATIAEREEYKRERRAKIDSDAQKVSSMQVDQNRLFADDPGGAFIAALAMGLGQFGASLTGGQNTAYDIIQTTMRNDREEQRRQIDEARLANEKADNALQRELDEGADPRFAEQKLELMQNRYASGLLRSQQVQQQLAAIGVDTADVMAQLEQDGISMHAALLDKIGVEASQKYTAPRAGGYAEDPRYWDKRKTAMETTQLAGELTGDFEPEAVRVERAKQELRGGSGPENLQKLGDAMGKGEGVTVADLWTQKDQTEQELQSLAQQAGGLPGRGLVADHLPDMLVSPQGRQVRRALGRSAEFMLRRLTGAAATDPETAKQLQQVAAIYEDAGSSPEEVQRAWRTHSELVDRMVAVRAAPYGRDALNQWKTNARDIMQDFNTGTDRGILGTGAPQE